MGRLGGEGMYQGHANAQSKNAGRRERRRWEGWEDCSDMSPPDFMFCSEVFSRSVEICVTM